MKNLILSSVLVLIASSAAHAQQAVQWKVQDGGNGHWYAQLNYGGGRTYTEAKLLCESHGGYLVTITSSGEQQVVCDVLTTLTGWIGAERTRAGWGWGTGEPWTYGSICSPTPNADRIQLYGCTCWNDTFDGDTLTQSAIIEWSADCNADGIVDYGQCRDGSLPDYNGNNVPDCCESGTPCVVGNYPVQWRVAEGGNGHWYQGTLFPVDTATPWQIARSFALSKGGDLVSLTTLAEADHVYMVFAENKGFWQGDYGPYVGLYQLPGSAEPSGGWVWVDGTPNSFAVPWYWNQPDNYAASCGGDQYAGYWTGGPWFPSPRNYLGDIAGSGFCCCEPTERIPSALFEWSADCNQDGIVDYGQILQGQLVDADVNGVPDVCEVDPCPGDITNGGTVDAADLSILLAAWGTNGQAEFDTDIDNSGLVDGGDLALVLSGWGPCPQ